MIYSEEFSRIIGKIENSNLENNISYLFETLKIDNADIGIGLNYIACEPDSLDMVSIFLVFYHFYPHFKGF